MTPILPFASMPSPAIDDRHVSISQVQLKWFSGRNAESHNVYFGKQNPPELLGSRQQASVNVSDLLPRTVYYWRVDEVTSDGIVEGKLWKFETK